MADDVKVKFGGDFSGVSKGANDAAAQAGSALAKSMTDKISAIGASIAGLFAIGAIASKVFEGFKAGIAYMHDLNLAITRTGQSSGEFQKLAYAGKEAGVSMDIVGRGLTEANKALERAKKDQQSRNLFASLGMDAGKLEAGTYTATEALLVLADQWDKFGNVQKTRAGAVALFGKYGEGMVPLIQQGRSAIEEQTASVREQTRAEILGAAAIEKKVAALERYTKQMERLAAASTGVAKVGIDYASEFDALKQMKRRTPEKYAEQYGDQTPAQVAAQKMSAEYKSKFGINPEEMAIIMNQALKNTAGVEAEAKAEFDRLSKKYVEERAARPTRPPEELAGALSASSLQAIGAGDIASVQTGTYNTQMLDTTREIAANTRPRDTSHAAPPIATAGR
jgi:hypothetical protein